MSPRPRRRSTGGRPTATPRPYRHGERRQRSAPATRAIVGIVVPAVAALMLAACAGAASPDDAEAPTAGRSADPGANTAQPGATATDRDGTATDPGSTAPRAYTVDQALTAGVDGPILVTGLLIDAGNGWRLCEAIAESYPPQCGGASVSVDGVDPAEYDLERADGVRWSEAATVVGTLDGDTLTVTGSAASS